MSAKINEAITFAAASHAGQIRKMEKTPYILHPMEAAAIAGSLTRDESIIIAALLHDVVEDTGIEISEIEKKFGKRVKELVLSETEDKRPDTPSEETWNIRKEESLHELSTSEDIGMKILWLSDKLSNMRSLYRNWLKQGDTIFNQFNQKNKKEHAWYYHAIAEYTVELSGTAAYEEYTELVNKVFE